MCKSRLNLRGIMCRRQEGAVEAVVLCAILVLCLIAITMYSIQLRVAKNVKYIVDDAVIAAATSALVTDLYQYATVGENVLDCTGNAFSNGMYEHPDNAAKEACKVAYGRFLDSVSTALGLDDNLIPMGGYVTTVNVREFTVYNVTDQGIYSCTYTASGYEDSVFHSDNVTVTAKEATMDVSKTSVYVDIEFIVEVFGREYQIPVQEYVYSHNQV